MDRETIKFIRSLKRYRREIPKQQLKTIKGQALAGDLKGARLVLANITKGANK